MGSQTSVYDKAGRLNPYPYPYSMTHKILQFPWRFYFVNSKAVRSLVYGVVFTSHVMFKFQCDLRSKDNKKFFKEVRKEYTYTHFSPPRPPTFQRG